VEIISRNKKATLSRALSAVSKKNRAIRPIYINKHISTPIIFNSKGPARRAIRRAGGRGRVIIKIARFVN
jgi:hypothetical protein